MSKTKGKEGKAKSDKTAPAKNLMEKRAAKEAKREAKKNDWYVHFQVYHQEGQV